MTFDKTQHFNMSIPGENQNSLVFGLLTHFGFPILFAILAGIVNFDPFYTVISFFFISIMSLIQILRAEKMAPSIPLNSFQRINIIKGITLIFLQAIGIGSIIVILSWLFASLFTSKISLPTWLAIGLTVVFSDFTYYFIHRFLNHSNTHGWIFRRFRKNHVEHHTVQTLDFLRGNHSSLIDTAILSFQIPSGMMGWYLGLDIIQVWTAYCLVLLLQSTHHVNYTFNIGWLRYIFVDNHNHKLHHCPRGYQVNFGAIFSVWDRFFGTCYENWNLSSSYLAKHRIALPLKRSKVSVPFDHIPAEQNNSIFLGCLGHFGAGVAVLAAFALSDKSPWLTLATFSIASTFSAIFILWMEKYKPCVDLPTADFKDKLKGIMHISFNAIFVGASVVTAGWWLIHGIVDSFLPSIIEIIAAVILSDLFYYILHRQFNHGNFKNKLGRWFRKNHWQHHSVKLLDFMRGSLSSFSDTAITGFQIPVLLSSAILGMDLISTLVAYSLLLILEGTHHANHTFNIGMLRYIFLDNHAHKMHHCLGGHAINHGVIFSFWDRLFGTYYENRSLSPSYLQKNRIPLTIQKN